VKNDDGINSLEGGNPNESKKRGERVKREDNRKCSVGMRVNDEIKPTEAVNREET
jgi:hypothetical protein